MASTDPGSPGGGLPVTSVSTSDLDAGAATEPKPGPDALYPEGVPVPAGTTATTARRAAEGQTTDPTAGEGVDGEIVVWEARYSNRNFIGRIFARVVFSIAWIALAIYTWGNGHENLSLIAWLTGTVLAVLWVVLIWRIIQAHYSHYYRLTNRRLFLSTGIVSRRRDMMELLRVKDVFTRQQSLFDRWLGLGTVVVVPDAKDLPTFYLTGVDDPKQIMDLIWHQARSERDTKAVMVDRV